MRIRAFTLIELLVVIAIMLTLAGMILGAAAYLRRSALRTKTSATIAAVQQALSLSGADRGGSISPAEHPLAGSKAERARFVRSGTAGEVQPGDEDLAATAWPYAVGDQVERNGLALRGVDPRRLVSAIDRQMLLLDDDLQADPRHPLLYGMPRSALGVFGVGFATVTGYQLLKRPPRGAAITAPAAANPLWAGRLIAPNDTAADGEALCAAVLARGSALSELQRSGGASRPVDDTTLTAGGRVWGPATDDGKQPVIIDGGRTAYRLRGTAFYDAWGRELLIELRSNQRFVIRSAGPDGCFRWDPGADGAFQTLPGATSPAGDDRDGSRDNVVGGD